MINELDMFYSNVGRGLKPVSNNKKTASGLKPISKGGGLCKKYGED